MIGVKMWQADGWEAKAAPSPLRPGERGQHVNGPALFWVRQGGGEWQPTGWKSLHRLSLFYGAFRRFPRPDEDERQNHGA